MNQLHFFSDDLRSRYGRKLYRIGIDLALGCPNRAGNYGPGCVFCNEDGNRARHLSRRLALADQVKAGIDFATSRYGAKPPYIAYFQAFTSTHAPVATLRRLYDEVLAQAPFAVVIIGTRPDCLPPETVAYLAELNRRYEVWVELGVQSAHDLTLELIRRGHDFRAVEEAATRLHAAGIRTACHVIAGLPGETREDFVATACRIAALPFQAVKLHPLLTLRRTRLAAPDFPIRPQGLNEYEYADWAAAFLRELPEQTLIMRLTAEADPADVITPRWWMSKGQFLEFFQERFHKGLADGFSGVETADGSRTLYHPEFRQHFHSLAGAESEAVHKFVEPATLAARLYTGRRVRLLDIGFGLGVNCMAALQAAGTAAADAAAGIDITTLEYDRRVLRAAMEICPPHSSRTALLQALLAGEVYRQDGNTVRMLDGDARQSVLNLPDGAFDVIFHDGFSPDCNPELWSYDFLRELKRLLRPDGVLVSYSSSYPYRGALLRAGFEVGESLPFGRRRGGTVAALDPALLPLPLPDKEYGIIRNSTAGVAYRDPGLTRSREAMQIWRQRTVCSLRRRGVPKWFKA